MVTIKDLAYIGCRFFALYVLYQFLFNISISISGLLLAKEINIPIFLTYGNLIIFYLLFFGVFWFKAENIANKVVGRYSQTERSSSQAVCHLERAIFIFIGIFILTKAVPNLFGAVILDLSRPNSFSLNSVAEYSIIFTQIIISIFLILGADFFSKLISKFRKW